MSMPASAMRPSSATKPKGMPETLSASDAPIMPSGAEAKTRNSFAKLCTCAMMSVSITSTMMGATAAMEELPLADSSMAPPISMR